MISNFAPYMLSNIINVKMKIYDTKKKQSTQHLIRVVFNEQKKNHCLKCISITKKMIFFEEYISKTKK